MDHRVTAPVVHVCNLIFGGGYYRGFDLSSSIGCAFEQPERSSTKPPSPGSQGGPIQSKAHAV